MRVVLYAMYWTFIAPLVFMIGLNVLLQPVGLLTRLIWPDPESVPRVVEIATFGVAVFGVAVAGFCTWWVWRRYQASVGAMRSAQAPEPH